ncbi:hypothetical protein QVD17_19153 [Tagetes erecta]|uniref:Uncharacterized protein n=1 Tax=Tagetes erecta TaxID=13708 RepID=A0AAD8NX09_TARER|nr:hypothetical protein QVD17_19153 [Tagetes erecta]
MISLMILFLIQHVGKAGSDKLKSMAAAEKTPYVAKAENRKSEYDKTLKAYDKKLDDGKTTKKRNQTMKK